MNEHMLCGRCVKIDRGIVILVRIFKKKKIKKINTLKGQEFFNVAAENVSGLFTCLFLVTSYKLLSDLKKHVVLLHCSNNYWIKSKTSCQSVRQHLYKVTRVINFFFISFAFFVGWENGFSTYVNDHREGNRVKRYSVTAKLSTICLSSVSLIKKSVTVCGLYGNRKRIQHRSGRAL